MSVFKNVIHAFVLTMSLSPAVASDRLDLNQFVGTFEVSSGECTNDIQIKQACGGLTVKSTSGNGFLNELMLCDLDNKTSRDLERNSGGHGIIPSIDYTKIQNKVNARERSISKIETTKSYSIIVFSSVVEDSIRLENDNSLVVSRTLSTSAGSDVISSTCHFRRK